MAQASIPQFIARWQKSTLSERSAAQSHFIDLCEVQEKRDRWLAQAHKKLDDAVLDAYGWPRGPTDDGILERLLGLNLERAKGENGLVDCGTSPAEG